MREWVYVASVHHIKKILLRAVHEGKKMTDYCPVKVEELLDEELEVSGR